MAWCLLETIIGEEFDKVLIVYMVALLEAVVGSDDFAECTTVWWGEVFGHAGT